MLLPVHSQDPSAAKRWWPDALRIAVLLLASAWAQAQPAGGPPSSIAPATDISQYEASGRTAALGWLMLLDRRDWGTAWEAASTAFRQRVPLAPWMDGIAQLRLPYGALVERLPVQTTYKTVLPDQPEGHYVTTVFASRFSERPELQETVSVRRESDGRWRVIGYSTR